MCRLLVLWLVVFLVQADDRLRPQYHLMPMKNWLNDPNGPTYFNGHYHMFYQHNPNAPVWGDMHWGHCYSRDMVHWIHLPIALAPDHVYDQNGIFTGSMTIVNGIPTIIYTGITSSNEQVQCLAQPANLSDPTLTNWTKSTMNPLITEPNGRDPSTAFQDDQNNFYLIYGYGTAELGGQAVLFNSTDFLHWTYLHPVHSNHYDTFWECPDIFRLSNRVILKASLLGRDFWTVGNFDWSQRIFVPLQHDVGEFRQLIDHGRFYASKSFFDPINDQQVIIGWVSEEDDRGAQRGWQGFHSLPRRIALSDDGTEIRTRPIEELKSLRNLSSHRSLSNISLTQETPFELIASLQGNQVECVVNWSFPLHQDLNFGLSVLSTLNGSQRTSVGILTRQNTSVMFDSDLPGWDYFSVPNITQWNDCEQWCERDVVCQSWTFVKDRAMNNNCFMKSGVPLLTSNSVCVSGVKQRSDSEQLLWFYVDRSLSQENPAASRQPVHSPIWTDTTFLSLDIFIDHSVIEVFEPNSGRFALTTRVYPEDETADHFALYAKRLSITDQPISIDSLDLWSLETIWNTTMHSNDLH